MMRIIMITESTEHVSDYSLNPKTESAGKNDGCTDENGKRRKIGEEWPLDDGCNIGRLVSN